MDLIEWSLDDLAQLTDEQVEAMGEDQLKQLFLVYDDLTFVELFWQTPKGVRLYLEDCVHELHDSIKLDDVTPGWSRVKRILEYAMARQDLYNNFEPKLPNPKAPLPKS